MIKRFQIGILDRKKNIISVGDLGKHADLGFIGGVWEKDRCR